MNVLYRAELTLKVMQQIIEGESISVISVPGNGKTHWQEHVQKPQVQDVLLGEGFLNSSLNSQSLLFITLDANGLGESGVDLPKAWVGIDLFLRSLYWAVIESHLQDAGSIAEYIADSLKKIGDKNNHGPERAFGILEQTIYYVYRNLPHQQARIIIILEEPELWFSKMPDEFFLNMRYLRDKLRYKLLFMMVARQSAEEVSRAKGRYDALESFIEIFRQPLVLGMYNDQDFQEMLKQLAERKRPADWEFPPKSKEILYWCVGGHGSLTRSCFDHLDVIANSKTHEALLGAFLDVEKIRSECLSLYKGLTDDEKHILHAVINDKRAIAKIKPADKQVVNLLIEKGLLSKDEMGDASVLPVLFGRYIHDYESNLRP